MARLFDLLINLSIYFQIFSQLIRPMSKKLNFEVNKIY